MKQIRTFQFRLPKGAHDAILDDWSVLAGKVIRYIHTHLRAKTLQAEQLPESDRAAFLRLARNALKTTTLIRFSITGRQYNGLLQQLTGLWDSRRALAKLDIERLESKIDKKQASINKLRLKVNTPRTKVRGF